MTGNGFSKPVVQVVIKARTNKTELHLINRTKRSRYRSIPVLHDLYVSSLPCLLVSHRLISIPTNPNGIEIINFF